MANQSIRDRQEKVRVMLSKLRPSQFEELSKLVHIDAGRLLSMRSWGLTESFINQMESPVVQSWFKRATTNLRIVA